MNIRLTDKLIDIYPEELLAMEGQDFNLYYTDQNLHVNLSFKDVQIHFDERSLYISKLDDEVDILVFNSTIESCLPVKEGSYKIKFKEFSAIIILEVPEWRQ